MIKFFPLFYIFAILLILNTSGKVDGAQCEKKIGICDENCNSKCEASKSGKGICEKLSPNDIGTCKCFACGKTPVYCPSPVAHSGRGRFCANVAIAMGVGGLTSASPTPTTTAALLLSLSHLYII
ncbi:hypothetical protein Goshw_014304 [Gossypium schwendimanii]|uniref:Defensin-like protein n=1 Tax=Gossypium schwendimanii TaxID=34291 RepID=A0A7J9L3A3_GOSSC|nr:hypothetical protein [Gossypium schwendimanii]